MVSHASFTKHSTLGAGAQGTCYLVKDTDNNFAVIKQVDIASLDEEDKKKTLQEAQVLSKLYHPNIVRYRDVYKTVRGKLCIVMDFVDGGDLASLIKRHQEASRQSNEMKFIQEELILQYFTQICLAVKQVHDHKFLHRDLKPQNIFVTKKGIIKLGDFGIARILSQTKSKAVTKIGTPLYTSPEIFQGKGYSFPTDVWSIGVLLYEMCTLVPPFKGGSLKSLHENIAKGKPKPISDHYSLTLTNLIKACLSPKASKRPTLSQLLQLPAIKPRVEQLLESQDFRDEFANSLIHDKRAYEAFKNNAQLQNTPKIDMSGYTPSKEYLDKYQNTNFLGHVIAQYLETYSQPIGGSNGPHMTKTLSMESVDSKLEDRDDLIGEDDESDKIQSIEDKLKGLSLEDEKEFVQSCDMQEFKAFMQKKFGNDIFEKFWQIFTENQELLTDLQDEGEEKLIQIINKEIDDESTATDLVDFVVCFQLANNVQKFE